MSPFRQLSPPRNVMDAHTSIVYYCKHGSFSDAEEMFKKLCEMINFQPVPYDDQLDDGGNQLEWKRHYSNIQINHFQKSISTLVRYAPTIQDALDYACFCLYQVPEPLRDESLEKILTINLIYLYKQQGGRENFTNALELIKSGVGFGYALPLENSSTFTNNSDAVFIDVSRSVLRYFGLNLSQDKKSIV